MHLFVIENSCSNKVDTTPGILCNIYSTLDEVLARITYISRQVGPQSQANRQTTAAVDGANSVGYADLFGHLDPVVYTTGGRGNSSTNRKRFTKRFAWKLNKKKIFLSPYFSHTLLHALVQQKIKDGHGLIFKQCAYNWWDHSLALGEIFFLAWGIRVCYNVRNAESMYNEARQISYAIYNIALVNCLMIAFQ